MSLVVDLTGLKLGQKKEFKETCQESWEKAAAKMFTKLGKDWKLHINLGLFFSTITDEKQQGIIYDRVGRKVVALAAELENLDGDLVEAFNDSCKTKQINLTIGGTSKDYPNVYRYGVVFGEAITVTFATDYWGENYPYGENVSVTGLALKHF